MIDWLSLLTAYADWSVRDITRLIPTPQVTVGDRSKWFYTASGRLVQLHVAENRLYVNTSRCCYEVSFRNRRGTVELYDRSLVLAGWSEQDVARLANVACRGRGADLTAHVTNVTNPSNVGNERLAWPALTLTIVLVANYRHMVVEFLLDGELTVSYLLANDPLTTLYYLTEDGYCLVKRSRARLTIVPPTTTTSLTLPTSTLSHDYTDYVVNRYGLLNNRERYCVSWRSSAIDASGVVRQYQFPDDYHRQLVGPHVFWSDRATIYVLNIVSGFQRQVRSDWLPIAIDPVYNIVISTPLDGVVVHRLPLAHETPTSQVVHISPLIEPNVAVGEPSIVRRRQEQVITKLTGGSRRQRGRAVMELEHAYDQYFWIQSIHTLVLMYRYQDAYHTVAYQIRPR